MMVSLLQHWNPSGVHCAFHWMWCAVQNLIEKLEVLCTQIWVLSDKLNYVLEQHLVCEHCFTAKMQLWGIALLKSHKQSSPSSFRACWWCDSSGNDLKTEELVYLLLHLISLSLFVRVCRQVHLTNQQECFYSRSKYLLQHFLKWRSHPTLPQLVKGDKMENAAIEQLLE